MNEERVMQFLLAVLEWVEGDPLQLPPQGGESDEDGGRDE